MILDFIILQAAIFITMVAAFFTGVLPLWLAATIFVLMSAGFIHDVFLSKRARRHRAGTAVDRLDVPMNPEWSTIERQAIQKMADERGMRTGAVIRQAVRLYQLYLCRLEDGETLIWSGDAKRARDFAGTGAVAVRTEDA